MLDAFHSGVTSCVDPDCRKSLKVPRVAMSPLADVFCLMSGLACKQSNKPHDVLKQVGWCSHCSTESSSFYSWRCSSPCGRVDLILDCVFSSQAMADLFALKCIYEEALFRNDDYVSPEKAKAIARMIEELCLEVRRPAFQTVSPKATTVAAS